MSIPDPHSVLGLSRGADKAAVKRAYREKALQTHPDINPSPAAAAEYDRIYKAAQAILNGLFLFKIYQKPDPQKTIGVSLKHKILLQTEGNPTSQGRPVEQGWKLAFEQFTRKSSFPLIFSAVCLVGGCVIFAGAVHAHKAIFDGYSYHVLQEAERRKEFPSPEQQRINLLLMEKREQDMAGRGQ